VLQEIEFRAAKKGQVHGDRVTEYEHQYDTVGCTYLVVHPGFFSGTIPAKDKWKIKHREERIKRQEGK